AGGEWDRWPEPVLVGEADTVPSPHYVPRFAGTYIVAVAEGSANRLARPPAPPDGGRDRTGMRARAAAPPSDPSAAADYRWRVSIRVAWNGCQHWQDRSRLL